MRAVRIVAVAPPVHDHPRLLQSIEEFAVEQFIPQFCSVIPSFRQASGTALPLPRSISMVRSCPIISSAVYRFRAMRPPFAGRNPNSRSDLVYRGQVTLVITRWTTDQRSRRVEPAGLNRSTRTDRASISYRSPPLSTV